MENESKSLIRKERLNYVVENGQFCGHLVNLPIVVQSESYEEMILDAKELAKAWVAVLQQVLEQEEPFKVVETKDKQAGSAESQRSERALLHRLQLFFYKNATHDEWDQLRKDTNKLLSGKCPFCCECDLKCGAVIEDGHKCTAIYRKDKCPFCAAPSPKQADSVPDNPAVAFAEWLGKHYETVLYLGTRFRWCTPIVSEYGGQESAYYTTQELYEKWESILQASKEEGELTAIGKPENTNDEKRCTLSDQELSEKCEEWISRLCNSGGREWTLRVPVDFDRDPDMLFSELNKRFKRLNDTIGDASGHVEFLDRENDRMRLGIQQIIEIAHGAGSAQEKIMDIKLKLSTLNKPKQEE
jgi:hypothetical protein